MTKQTTIVVTGSLRVTLTRYIIYDTLRAKSQPATLYPVFAANPAFAAALYTVFAATLYPVFAATFIETSRYVRNVPYDICSQ